MRTPIRVALATALLAPLAAVASSAAPAGAAPAPTVSATAGAPGTRVTVSVPDCTADLDAGTYLMFRVLLVSGTAPAEVLIGAGASTEGSATVVVPDWVDASQPATLEASCEDYSDVFEDDAQQPVTTRYDAVPFDVLPGVGAPTQVSTLSRTSLLVGQALEVRGSGCNLPGAAYAGADVFAGTDLSGRSAVEGLDEGSTEVVAKAFQTNVLLSDGGGFGYGFSYRDATATAEDLSVDEFPNHLAAGPYVVAPYCADEDGVALLYEPTVIDVTGVAPVADLDLTTEPDSRSVTLAGGSCTSGTVQASIESESIADILAEDGDLSGTDGGDLAARRSFGRPGASPFASPAPRRAGRVQGRASTASLAAARSTRALADDGYTDVALQPDGTGAWSHAEPVGFDQGFAFGSATCGDPLGDGWVYDDQSAVVEVAAAPVTTTTAPVVPTTAAPAPAAAPADAVAGRPTYAG